MNSYFLCITQYSNVGDLLINKMLVEELCLHGKVFVDAFHVPENFKSLLLDHPNAIDVTGKYGISLKKMDIWRVYRLISKQKIELYTESPGPIRKLPLSLKYLFVVIHHVVKYGGAHVVKIGNCCSTAILKKQKINLNGIEHLYVRSEESVKYLNRQYNNIASYIPDLACLLRFRIQVPNTKKNIIAINLRCEPEEKDIMIKESLTLIQNFSNKGFQILVYYQVAVDRVFAEQLYKNCAHIDNVSLVSKQICYSDLSFYSDVSFVVSNRLHSLLIGSVYNCIPIAYGIKNHKCAKIEHVFVDLFGDKCNLFMFNDSEHVMRAVKNEKEMRNIVYSSIEKAANVCRTVVEDIKRNMYV